MPEPLVSFGIATSHPEIDLLLSCARSRISRERSDRIRAAVQKGINWIVLIRLALQHDVMPLLYRSLQQACPDFVPENIFGPLGARYRGQAMEARCRAEELVRILPLFEAEGIFAVPYKGPMLAQRLYGDLSLREFGDLDIMILERDVPRARDLIRRHGYEYAHPKDVGEFADYVRTNRELPLCRADGKMLELHWRFATRRACVKHDPDRFLQRLETISLSGARVPSLSLEVYLLILTLHATKHKWRQLKLICDIAEILEQRDLDWQYVLREAHDLGLKRMLAVGMLLAEDALTVVAPAGPAQSLRRDRVAQALAAEVRRKLFEEPDETWHFQADYRFQVRIRERVRDKVRMFLHNLLPNLTPNEHDRRFLPMPESFSFMYYLVRPFRLVWEKVHN